jgi:hypothetical protein
MNSTIRPFRVAVLAGAAAMFAVSTLALASDSETSAVSECSAIQDAAARLACYDELKPPHPAETSTPDHADVPETNSRPVAEPKKLDDEVGRESLDHKEADREVKVRGHVVQCRTNERGSYFFFFENGQMWQQKDSKRIAWKECDFEVTIDKDYFGYGMVKDGDDRRIRISRVK